MKIAVVGLGAIGGVVAGSLVALGRYDVVACVRTPIKRLVIERPNDTVEVPIRALTAPADAEYVDWVLLCTKAHQMPSAWLARLCGPGTRVAVLQNGIGQATRLAPHVGMAAIVPTVVYYNGEKLAPDRMRFRRAGQHELAVRNDADGRDFAGLLAGTPMRVLLSADFATLAWRKLLINAVANPITALTLQRQAVFRREDIKDLCLAVLREAVEVGRADGARLDDDEAARIMATLLTYPADAGTSMYFDRLGGRALEVEALTGAIVSRGKQLGVATPLNGMLLSLLRAVSDGATGGGANEACGVPVTHASFSSG
ncbi:MAG: 2-dehydropantoate 2-reductase [Candidimonas sp.]|nr:MAG: 2-dehydropantoate 2-reductase [Candidimonas sp.]